MTQISALMQGCPIGKQDALLSFYFTAKLFKKALDISAAFEKAVETPTTALLLMDPARWSVFLQRRGDFKWLYPGTITVSAAATRNRAALPESWAKLIQAECAVAVNPQKF